MRRYDKKRIIQEANERLERNYLNSKGLLKEEKKVLIIPKTTPKEDEIVADLLGEGDILTEGAFETIKNKFGSLLKKGTMTLGILAAVMATPKISSAQKAELKKDVTNSTWFLDKTVDNEHHGGVDRETGAPLDVEKWINNLGQDSTVYKFAPSSFSDTWKEKNPDAEVGGYHSSNVSDKDYPKAWKGGEKGKEWSVHTKKGEIADYLWTKDNKTSITPDAWKAMKKMEKGGKMKNDVSYEQAKTRMDKGFESSDFQKVDLKNMESPLSYNSFPSN